jgi:2'-5' RNA ligase
MRLFVALGLPEDVRQELAGLRRGLPDARWVAEDNYHITLRFIGGVTGATAEDVDDALMGVEAPAFTFHLKGVGHFGPLQKARMLWAGVEENPMLVHLRNKIESALVRIGLPPEDRKFVPHVTLARIKGETGHHLANILAEHNTYRSAEIEANAFTLYRSHTKHDGAVYEPLADYPLQTYLL